MNVVGCHGMTVSYDVYNKVPGFIARTMLITCVRRENTSANEEPCRKIAVRCHRGGISREAKTKVAKAYRCHGLSLLESTLH